jgi:hypothetical protein
MFGHVPSKGVFQFAIGIFAAGPTLAGAVMGAGLLVDDWWFAAKSRYESFLHAYGRQTLSRPIEGIWGWAEFKLLDTHRVPHLLVLAAVNAAAAILLWRLLLHWVPRRIAILTVLVWVVLANKGSTHLWLTNSPHVFSLVLLLAALLVASNGEPVGKRLAVAVGLLVLATFAYEGALAIGAVGLALLIWFRSPADGRVRRAAISLAVLAAAGGWTLVTSPKIATNPAPPFRDVSHLLSAHFGSGVLPGAPMLLTMAVLVLIAWSAATFVLPSFEPRSEERLVFVGLAVMVLGAAPFAAGGFAFATDGLFDRGNLFADLGTSLLFACGLSMLWRLPWRPVAVGLALAALVALAIPNMTDVDNFVTAQRDGQRFLRAVDALPLELRTKGPVTFLPLPNRGGVSMFVAEYDTSSGFAVRYRTGWPYPFAQMAVPEAGYQGPRGPTYELVGRHLVQR